eukprot:9467391-Pyramimonas_sp.AAC.1
MAGGQPPEQRASSEPKAVGCMGMGWREGLSSRGRVARLARTPQGRGWRTRFQNGQARSTGMEDEVSERPGSIEIEASHPSTQKNSGILGSKGLVGCTRPRRGHGARRSPAP